MPTVFFTADSHFGHARILQLAKRSFRDVREHDEALIRAWNEVVGAEDEVWHGGDFGFGDPARIEAVFARLNGEKHLVVGNHDREALALPWASVSIIAETVVDGQRVTLCHYPMRSWPGARRGAIHLFGHMHGSFPGTSLSLDVGVDCWDFRPVTLRDIRRRLRSLPPDPDFESSTGARR